MGIKKWHLVENKSKKMKYISYANQHSKNYPKAIQTSDFSFEAFAC